LPGQLTRLPLALSGYVEYLPYALALLCILLAFGFHRGRIMLAALLLGLVYWAASTDRETLLPLVQILYPLNLAVIIWYRKRGLISPYGLMRFGLIGLQVALFWLLYSYSPQNLHNLLHQRWLDSPLLHQLYLSQPGLLIIVPALTVIAARTILTPSAIHAAMVGSVAAVLMAGLRPDIIYWMTSFMIAGGLMLIYGLLHDSYRMAFFDELTGLPARRALQHKLATLGNQYTIAMLDVDHFKQFNDTHGHDVGDQVLKMVAGHMQRVTGGGKAYRYGGEEFTIVFPRKTIKQCIPHLSNLRETIEEYTLLIRGEQRPKRSSRGKRLRGRTPPRKRVSVTVSIGVAECNDELQTTKQVMEAADQALYRAKANGRNRISR
jgi:diguanylate cyclase (GGDEF)-like protein